jgi:hypothetical protein
MQDIHHHYPLLVYALCDLRLQKHNTPILQKIGNETKGWREFVTTINDTVQTIFSRAAKYIESIDISTFFASVSIPNLDAFLQTVKSLIALPADATMASAKALLSSFFYLASKFWAFFNLEDEAAIQTRISLIDLLTRFASVFVSALKSFFESILQVVVAAIRRFAELGKQLGTLCGQALKSVVVTGKKSATHAVLFGMVTMLESVKMGGVVSDAAREYMRTQSLELTNSMQSLEAEIWKPAQWLVNDPLVLSLKKGVIDITELIIYTLRFLPQLLMRVAFASLSYLPEFATNVFQQALDIVQPIISDVIRFIDDTKQRMTDLRIPLNDFSVHLDAAEKLMKDPTVSNAGKQRLQDAVDAVTRFKDHLMETQTQHYRDMLTRPIEMASKINKIATFLQDTTSTANAELMDDILFMELGLGMEEFSLLNDALQERLKASIILAVADDRSAVPDLTLRRRRRPLQHASDIDGRVFGTETVAQTNEDIEKMQKRMLDLKLELDEIKKSPKYVREREYLITEFTRLLVNPNAQKSILVTQKEALFALDEIFEITQRENELKDLEELLEKKTSYKRSRLNFIESRASIFTGLGAIALLIALCYKLYSDHQAKIAGEKSNLSKCIKKWSKNDPLIRRMLKRWQSDPSYHTMESLEPNAYIDDFKDYLTTEQLNIRNGDVSDKDTMQQYLLLGRDLVESWKKDVKIAMAKQKQKQSEQESLKGILLDTTLYIYTKICGPSSDSTTSGDRADAMVNDLLEVNNQIALIGSEGNSNALSTAAEFKHMFSGPNAFDLARFYRGPSDDDDNSKRRYMSDLSNFMHLRISTLQSQLENYSDSLDVSPVWWEKTFAWWGNQVASTATYLYKETGLGGFDYKEFRSDPGASVERALTSVNPALLVQLICGVKIVFFTLGIAVTIILLLLFVASTMMAALWGGDPHAGIGIIMHSFKQYGKLFGFLTTQLMIDFMSSLYSRFWVVSVFYIMFQIVVALYLGWIAKGIWGAMKASKYVIESVAKAGISTISYGGSLLPAAKKVEKSTTAITDKATSTQFGSSEPKEEKRQTIPVRPETEEERLEREKDCIRKAHPQWSERAVIAQAHVLIKRNR